MKTCHNDMCTKHGIKLRSGSKHCPACGRKTILIGRMYLPIGAVWIVCISLVLVAIFAIYVPSIVESNRLEDLATRAKEQKVINELPTEWSIIYASLKSTTYHVAREQIINTINIADMPKLSADQVTLIAKTITTSNARTAFLVKINGGGEVEN